MVITSTTVHTPIDNSVRRIPAPFSVQFEPRIQQLLTQDPTVIP
jgi:hypothetical protein